jgi:hypothetical protein
MKPDLHIIRLRTNPRFSREQQETRAGNSRPFEPWHSYGPEMLGLGLKAGWYFWLERKGSRALWSPVSKRYATEDLARRAADAAKAPGHARENPARRRKENPAKRRRLARASRRVSRRDGFLVEFLRERAAGKLEFWYIARDEIRKGYSVRRITRTRAKAKFYESERAAAIAMRDFSKRLNKQFKLARVVPA